MFENFSIDQTVTGISSNAQMCEDYIRHTVLPNCESFVMSAQLKLSGIHRKAIIVICFLLIVRVFVGLLLEDKFKYQVYIATDIILLVCAIIETILVLYY